MSEIITTWFVEPRDPLTNKVIAEFLSETEIHRDVMCGDGISRDLWDCDYRFTGRLLATTEWLKLKFWVFRRKGGGKIERWQFAPKHKQRRWPAGVT